MMKKMVSFSFTMLMTSLLLAGCATTKSNFNCPYKGTAMCKRLDQVNTMVNRGQITANGYQKIPVYPAISPQNKRGIYHQRDKFSKASWQPYPPGTELRYGDTVLQAWIAPFIDKKNVYHQASVVDVIAQQGFWLGQTNSTHTKGT